MKPRYRPIRPAGNPSVSVQMKRSRRSITYSACSACQKRKSKCNGARPICHSCESKGTQCDYSIPQGKTRLDSLRATNQALEMRLENALGIFKRLQTLPNPEAEQIFQCLRAGENSMSLFHPDAEVVDEDSSASSSDITASNLSATLQMDTLVDLMEGMEESVDSYSIVDISSGLQVAVPTASTFELTAAALFGSTGHVDQPYTPEMVNELLKELIETGPHMTEVQLGEICAISCIGCRFSQDTILPSLGELFYVAARNLLENIIADNPLPAMKICSLLAVYCAIDKPIVAAGILELGVAIGHSWGFCDERPSEGMPRQLEITASNKKVWRILMYFKSWFGVFFGFSSHTPFNPTDFAFKNLIATPDFDLEDLVQLQIARLSVLKTNLFQSIAKTGFCAKVVRSFQSNLQEWFGALPQEMHLRSLVAVYKTDEQRRVVYYVHIIHLSTMMLLYRRMMMHYNPNEEKTPFVEDPDLDNIASGIYAEGLLAAKQVARILHLLMSEGALLKKSWICVFTTYIACAIAMRSAFMKIITNEWSEVLEDDIKAARMAIIVLQDCSKRDYLARQIYNFLKHYFGLLLESHLKRTRSNSTTVDGQQPDDSIPRLGELYLAELPFVPPSQQRGVAGMACRDLEKLIRQPFASIPGIQIPRSPGLMAISIEEIWLGIHLDWSGEPLPIPNIGRENSWPGSPETLELYEDFQLDSFDDSVLL